MVRESIAKQASKPLSQDQCKQLVDAIHLAAIPEALDNQILKLQEADDKHRVNHNEQLRLLKDIQTSLMENKDNIHRSLEKHRTCMEQHVDQILQDQNTQKNTLSDLRYETRSITSKIDQIQADLSPYEAKNSTEEQQMSLTAIHTALEERIRALEGHVTPPVGPNTRDSSTISTSQTIAFAFGALASGLVAAVSRNDASSQHTCLCSSMNRLSTAKNQEISYNLPAEKPANTSPKLARNIELYHNLESNVVKPSSTGVSTHAKSKSVAWTSEFMSVNEKDAQGIQESRNDPGCTMYTKLSDAITSSKESESASTKQYKCPYGEGSACHPFAMLQDLEEHIVSVHNRSATPLSCPKEGCSRKWGYGFEKKNNFRNKALLGPYHLGEEALVDPTYFPDWSSAPLRTLHCSHHFANEEHSETNFDSSFAPLPVPQGPCRFAGGELSDPTLDLPLLSHDGAHTAIDDGHFEPIPGSVEGATDTVYDEQFNVLHELLSINPNDTINGFWGLDGFAFTTDPTPEMTNSSGITTQRNGIAFTSPSLPATQIVPNDAISGHGRGYPQSPCIAEDLWICCQCGSENLECISPEQCPACEHLKCRSCHVSEKAFKNELAVVVGSTEERV